MMLRIIVIFALLAISAWAGDTACDTITAQKTCLATAEGGENCAWCTSAATGKGCYKESDAKSLPSSIFSCDYQKFSSGNLTESNAAQPECTNYSDKKTCFAETDGLSGEQCCWCTSGAVGSSCNKKSDANSLPSSIFQCSCP